MSKSALQQQPHEVLVSAFKRTNDLTTAITAGFKELVDGLGFESGSICFIDIAAFKVAFREGDAAVERDKPGSGGLKTLTSQQSVKLTMRALKVTDLVEFSNDGASVAEWQGYFDLCGSKFKSNVFALIRDASSLSGFVALQRNATAPLTESEHKLIMNFADLLGTLLFYHKWTLELRAAAKAQAKE